MTDRASAYRGSLLGLAAGDAVGTTVEFAVPASFPPVTDIVDARVWSGIHFRFADEEGAKIGRKVAQWGNRHAFR